MAMVQIIRSKKSHRWSKGIAPAILILIFTIFLSVFLGDFTFLKGSEAIYKGLFRFFRITLFLYLPFYFLLPVFGWLRKVVQRKNSAFLQVEEKQDLEIHPVKHWLLRPLQGIGIGLLFETKLLAALQIITGVTTKPPFLFDRSQFQLGRMLVISGITVAISLLLSTLWTLDDVGIRYVNRKNQEIKMIGRYVGTLMPILFGFYGIFSLISDFPIAQVTIYLFKTVIILYPPFTVFTVFHTRFLRSKAEYFSEKASLRKGGIWYSGE